MKSERWMFLQAATLSCVAATTVNAQEDELGTIATAAIRSEIELNDNYDLRPDSLGNALIWRNIFSYGFASRTTADRLNFDARGTVRASDLPEIGTDVAADDPRLALSYGRTVDDSALRFGARYQRNDLNFFDPLSDVDDDGNFDPSGQQGTRESIRATAGIELNEDGPVSFAGDLAYSQVNFYDLSDSEQRDSDFDDRERISVNGEFGFRVSPVLTLTTGASYASDLYSSGGTDNETIRADVGANARINPRLSSRFRIGYSQVDSQRGRRGVTETQTGVVGNLDFVIEERTGETRFGIGSTLDENGERYQATVGKLFTTDTTSLDGNVGITTSDETDIRFIGGVAYTYRLPRTEIGARFRQSAGVNQDGDNVLNSLVSLGISQSVTRTSRLNARLEAGLIRNETRDNADESRVNFSASYSHAINNDWSWDVGYRGRYEEDQPQDSAFSNAIFAGVTRDFSATR